MSQQTQPRGEASNYYQNSPDQSQQYDEQPKYNQAPPQYGNGNGNSYAPPIYAPQNYSAQGEKQDFNQAFKVDKPKWNDWWAGLLVCDATGICVKGLSLLFYTKSLEDDFCNISHVPTVKLRINY